MDAQLGQFLGDMFSLTLMISGRQRFDRSAQGDPPQRGPPRGHVHHVVEKLLLGQVRLSALPFDLRPVAASVGLVGETGDQHEVAAGAPGELPQGVDHGAGALLGAVGGELVEDAGVSHLIESLV